MSTILIVDDEPGIRSILSDILEDEGYSVLTAEDGFQGLNILKTSEVSLVFLDVWLPNMGGIDVLKEIKKDYRQLPVVIISGHGNIDMAVKAIKMGAYDFLEKPLSLEKITTLTRNALELEQLKKENQSLKQSLFPQEIMIGRSKPINKIRSIIEQSADSDARMLILGENGTGKELVAREIHKQSQRNSGPFVEVNCAAIPDNLIESELFGHEKGAFTSAINQKKGKFELADKGTLFLDEVADMSLSAQAKVLRAIQEMKFERVGGEKSVSVDIRVIAATNKDIQTEISKGNFREDLYFRLNVIPIYVPPLRERKDDIALLIEYFISKTQMGYNKKLNKEALEYLTEYHWPGNIRELKNFVERITVMCDDSIINLSFVKQYLHPDTPKEETDHFKEEFGNLKLQEARDKFEIKLITSKLRENDNNISKTAQALGVYPSNLHGKIKKFGIEIEK
ncbi:sigma-54-dependent transcriptional regulator [Spirochaeta cellobiosiphila]|uniref:sigma-54-dependent transcriptional regulator n=1 Tax=Spirochaeta cellobiosiphila TaxID=504483 RepID=UPI0004116712|nr:sigma-54 dependent transcriptional regulator [Spirochaeta cellobiosiphila]